MNSYSFPRRLPAAVLLIAVSQAFVCEPAAGQIDGQMPVDVVAAIRDDDPQAALQLLADAVDNGIITKDLVYSSLPSATGAISRTLLQMDADQRYDLLESWTFPESDSAALRLLATPVPTEAPPKVFARSIGERPRDTTFAVASVGPVDGCFCSGWMLVQAAEELGRLSRLKNRLEQLQQQNVPGAQQLLILAQLAGSRGDLQVVEDYLAQVAAKNSAGELTPGDIVDASIAMAALRHEGLHSGSEAVLNRLIERGVEGAGISLRPFLRIAHAVAVQVYRGTSPPEWLWQQHLKHWIPVSVRTAKELSRAQPQSLWLTHEKHVLHLAGGASDLLLCRYPVQGKFDFLCEAQEGGSIGTDGGLVYGGLHFQATGRNDRLSVRDADGRHLVTRYSPFARFENGPVFNRVSIRSKGDAFQFESNFHPVWTDPVGVETSPWIGLHSSGTKRPVFRNLRITGEATIPESVPLLGESNLRGWQTNFFAETQPSYAPEESAEEDNVEAPDWVLESGVLTGRSVENDAADLPSLIRYQRPLLEDESITYEFQMSEAADLHPAFGRLAFLLEPTGIRVRWITTGPEDWTTLPADNAALEPLYRRGPRPLPLKPNSWNQMTLSRADEKLQVAINDTLVYERPLDHDSQKQFGLYRANRKTDARVRNVVLKGNWPKSLPGDLTKSP